MRISVFASHEGSDLQAIIDGCKTGRIKAQVCAVISNNSKARALARAKNANISAYFIDYKSDNQEELDKKIARILDDHNTDIIILAGYLKKLGNIVLTKYENRIFNIHPSLLPKYGGKGMYGINVHRAVIEAREQESGITIHRVNSEYDEGAIVAQTRIDVLINDTPERLANRILKREHTFIVEFLVDIVSGKLKLGL